MRRQKSRDVRTRTFPWTRPWMHIDAFGDTTASAHCCTYVCAFALHIPNVDNADGSTSAHWHIHERVCKLILSVHGGHERYLALSIADSCNSLYFSLPTPPMVRLDTDPLQMPADTDGISGGSENVCVCTSLICSGRHQSQWPPPQLRRAM